MIINLQQIIQSRKLLVDIHFGISLSHGSPPSPTLSPCSCHCHQLSGGDLFNRVKKPFRSTAWLWKSPTTRSLQSTLFSGTSPTPGKIIGKGKEGHLTNVEILFTLSWGSIFKYFPLQIYGSVQHHRVCAKLQLGDLGATSLQFLCFWLHFQVLRSSKVKLIWIPFAKSFNRILALYPHVWVCVSVCPCTSVTSLGGWKR